MRHPFRLCILVLCLVLIPSTVFADSVQSITNGNWSDAFTWSEQYGSMIGGTYEPTGYGDSGPIDMAADASGNIYVSDSHRRVQQMDVNGNFVSIFGDSTRADGDLFGVPPRIAVDSSGNIYGTDALKNRLYKYNSSHQLLWIVGWGVLTGANQLELCTVNCLDGISGSGDGQFNLAQGVAVDASGNVYVADRGNDRIQKFNSSGGYITKWGTTGSGNGQLNGPAGIAVDSGGNIYVVDSSNIRIQKFNSSGTYITKWGAFGSGNGQFSSPMSIAVDASNNVYVTEGGNDRVQKFDSSGNYVTKWGTVGAANGQFDNPEGISIGSDGSVFVADGRNKRVQKFTSSGVFSAVFTGYQALGKFANPKSIAFDSADNMYVTESVNRRVQKLSATGTYITAWGTAGTGNGQFGSTMGGVAVDSSGNVYVADTENNRIQKFNSSGNYVTKWGTFGTGDGQMNAPFDVDIDSSGNVYVMDYGNARVQKFNSSGTYITKWGSATAGDGRFSLAKSITIDASNNVYVAEGGAGQVQKFDSSGNYITSWDGSGAGESAFANPNGIDVNTAGDIVVGDQSAGLVKIFTTSGVFKYKIGSYGSGPGQFSSVADVGINSTSDVWVVDSAGYALKKFSHIVPSTDDDVTISNVVNLTNNVAVNNLTINSGKTLSLGSNEIMINGVFNSNGTTTSTGAGSLVFASSTYDLTINESAPIRGELHNLTIASGGNVTVASSTLTVNGLNVASGGTLDLNGKDLIVSGDLTLQGTFINDGNIVFENASSSNVTIGNGNEFNLTGDTELNNLTILSGGTVNLNGFTLTINGDWSNDGNFDAGLGTVIFQGDSNQISGNTTFYNLIKNETSTSTLNFEAGSVTTVVNNLQLIGANGAPINIEVPSTDILTFDSTFGSFGTGNGQFDSPHDIAIDNSGNIYVSDTKNNRIQKFSSTGSYISKFGQSGTAAGRFSNPLGIAFDSAGNIYIADNKNNRVQKFDSNHNFLRMWGWGVATGADQFEICTSSCLVGQSTSDRDVDGMMWAPHGITIGPDNHVYVTQFYGTRRPYSSILEFDQNGNFISRWGTWDNSGSENTMKAGYGISFDSSGNLYAVDANQARVMKFDTNHNFVKMWGWGVATGASQFEVCTSNCLAGIGGYGEGQFNYIPTGLAIDTSGDIYVAENFNGRIQRFTSGGAYDGAYDGHWGSANGEFDQPYGLVFDSNNDLYVADSENNRIQKFSITTASATIVPQGSVTANYLSVSGITNNGGSAIVCTTGCIDQGGNGGWTFTAPSNNTNPNPPSVSNVGVQTGGSGGGSVSERPQSILSRQVRNEPTPAPVQKPEETGAVQTGGSIPAVLNNVQFNNQLTVNRRSSDVMLLQIFLNSDPQTRIAIIGPGSKGKETNLYGPATKAAVQKFQLKYGIVKSAKDPGYGVFGPKTRAKVNELIKKK